MWHLGSPSDGIPFMQKQNLLLLSRTQSRNKGISELPLRPARQSCVKDFKGAGESDSILSSRAGKCFKTKVLNKLQRKSGERWKWAKEAK
jgi:hypothetical protein